MEKLLTIVFFQILIYNYVKTVLSEEHLKTLLPLGNHSCPECVKNSNLNGKRLIFVGQHYLKKLCLLRLVCSLGKTSAS